MTNTKEGFLDRLIKEEEELKEKLDKLTAFLNNPDSKDIVGLVQHELLIEQLTHMEKYHAVLKKRVLNLIA